MQKAEKELSGSTRIGTAIAVARETYPGGPKGVIVAKSNNFPDALAASTLAGAKGYPILLNPSDALDPDLRAYLRATKGTLGEIILIGDKNSLSRKVESDIRAIVPSVQRIGGVDRFDTARLLREAAKKAGAASDTAVVARRRELQATPLLSRDRTAFPMRCPSRRTVRRRVHRFSLRVPDLRSIRLS